MYLSVFLILGQNKEVYGKSERCNRKERRLVCYDDDYYSNK